MNRRIILLLALMAMLAMVVVGVVNRKYLLLPPAAIVLIVLFAKWPEFFVAVMTVGQSFIHFLFSFMGGISRAEVSILHLAPVGAFGLLMTLKLLLDKKIMHKDVDLWDREATPLVFTTAAFLALMLAGLAYTGAPNYGRSKTIAYFVYNFGIMLFVLIYIRDVAQIRRLILFVIGFGILNLVAIMVHTIGTYGSILVSLPIRPGDTPFVFGERWRIEHGHDLGRRFSAFILCGIAFIRTRQPKLWPLKVPVGVAILLSLLFVILSGARGATLGFLLSIVIVYLVIDTVLRRNSARAVVLTAGIATVALISFLLAPEGVQDRYLRAEKTAGITDRSLLLHVATQAIKDRPVRGWGTGHFPILFNLYGEFEARARAKKAIGDSRVYPHNIILETWIELGLLGLLIFLAFLALSFSRVYVGLKRAPPGTELHHYQMMCLALFLSALAYSMTSGDFRSNDIVWIYSALIVQVSILSVRTYGPELVASARAEIEPEDEGESLELR